MNKWSLKLIKELLNIKSIINVPEDIIFDYLRIVDLNKVKYEETANNVLFFFTYSTDKDITDEFIINPFDQRKKANDIIKNNPDYVYVIDEITFNNLEEENKKAKFIVVDNILDSIDKLFNYINQNKRAKVIAVTGSVGKTTAVGLIENVVSQKYNVFRIYSKRITPIILKANVINFITNDVDYITIEMSIYHHDHVEILSDLLHPDIAGLIGVDSSHLEFFNSVDDICKYKASIFRYAKDGFYNNLDDRVNKLAVKDNTLYFEDEKIYETNLENFDKIATEYQVANNKLIVDNQEINLFFSSTLSIVQSMLAYKIGKLLGINVESIVEAINNYSPVENRIQIKEVFGKKVVFDGDITTHERIKQLANHNYDESYLVIRKFGSAENNKRFEHVLESLDKFTKVFVFNDIEYLRMLKSHPKVQVVNNHDFMKELNGQIIYHYSGYYRSFNEYNENNLVELENEIYKIMKPEE
ncbi:MAG: hypothetical protein E7167_02555 [Firmicutes bacterium]|nr:hypothetical protein [Bacillota bacterium]